MYYKSVNPYFVRTVIAVLIVLISVVCVVLMSTSQESDKTDISDTTATTAATTEIIEETIETVTETTTPPETTIPEITEATNPKPTKAPSEAPSDPVTDEPSLSNPMSDLEMLACVIYQEAGGDAICQDCRYRVGDIVLNRVADDRFPNDIYGVLTEKNQYGKFYKTGVKWPSRASKPEEAHAVERAYQVAQDILNGNHGELYGNGYVWQAGFTQGTEGFWCCGHFYAR